VGPDARTRQRLAGLDLGPADGLRVLGPDEWHVTLRFLGTVDDRRIPELTAAVDAAVAGVAGAAPVVGTVGPATAWFTGARVLQIPVGGLDALAGAVHAATAPIVPGRGRREHPFTGHLTVARSTGVGPDDAARDRVAGVPFASSFTVDAVDLVRSVRTDAGARYRVVSRIVVPYPSRPCNPGASAPDHG
jgi:RNA 2',3'-cyclic 3'-phosphodiesterase